ncbi:hypothetical protein SCD_n02836 [Sulfuricella denitrificans skB26]|uniref:Uncharacterized protein n=1 Tax=Sulfuricella denitrificans (strain DSM 22764 / NBRC 105220 / skB26) TaxID=1163617 RepID=S6ABB3_SULDS|nr:hypothetical protein [Sulfuricella denitrificans]BAN36635.1 hypothetical protein SCD_n02836 [Sulfuricella denitrificans skB26]
MTKKPIRTLRSVDSSQTLPDEDDKTLYVIHEAIIGTFGLPPDKMFVSIKGDPTLRETASLRPRQESRIDLEAGKVLETCEWLLRKTGCFSIYVGFNSSEVRTESVFNPFNYEIHDAIALIQPGYVERHFVKVPYQKKLKIIGNVRNLVQTGPLREYLPPHWRTLMDRQREEWKPMAKKDIKQVVQSLNRLRGIEGFYLRNAAISLSQGIVCASFNCDGTYIVAAEYFPQFVEENTP